MIDLNQKNYLNNNDNKTEKLNELSYDGTDMIDLGTTIMAIVYDGGVLLAADTRTSSGSYVAMRSSDKIWPIHKNIYGLKTGAAAHSQFVLRLTQNYISQFSTDLDYLPPVKSAARMASQFLYEYKNFLQSAFIVAGWDQFDGPQIFTVGMGGSVTKQKFAMSGSGSYVIHGFVDANFKENMTRQQAEDFVIKACSLAMYKDNSSGGMIRLVNIDKNGATRDLKTQPNDFKYPGEDN